MVDTPLCRLRDTPLWYLYSALYEIFDLTVGVYFYFL